MRLRLVKEPFDDPNLIFELKHDGFRAVAYVQNRECKILSRNSNQLRFKSLRENLARLPVQNAIIDGEIICIDGDGVSRFNDLLDHKHEPVLYAFDLLWINGVDLRRRPLLERKKQLERLVRTSGLRLMYAQQGFVQGDMCARSEGIVAKRKLSIYKDGGTGWLKIKNRAYSQVEGRHELLTRKSASADARDSE
jgi:bifunctional non-homologous end joining protein LigD